MYKAVITYCDASAAITAPIPAFATVLTAFKAEVEALDTTAQLEAEVISGITINKDVLKKSSGRLWRRPCRRRVCLCNVS